MLPNKLHIPFIACLAIILLFSNCRTDPKDIVTENPNEFSIEEQNLIGDKIADFIHTNQTSFSVLDESDSANQQAYQYLRDSIFKVVINTHAVDRRLDLDWKINIIHDDNERNIFVLPGGELFIYTGLLKFLNNNAELMGVIAHEVAYADGDWVVDNLISQFEGRSLNDILNDRDQSKIEEIAEYFKIIGYEREAVVHADTFAMNLICPFRYDPSGLKNVLERANNDLSEFKWIQTKNPDAAVRMELIEEFMNRNDCNDGSNVTLEDSYDRFIRQYLP